MLSSIVFFSNDTAPTEIYTLSLHDALPISELQVLLLAAAALDRDPHQVADAVLVEHLERVALEHPILERSEEHTSELQSLTNLVCRLLLEKKKKNKQPIQQTTP